MLNRPSPRNLRCWLALASVLLALAAVPQPLFAAEQADESDSVEARLRANVNYLASDDLEGRAAGTPGADLAANYIAAQFTQLGLKTDLFDGKPLQTFTVSPPSERSESQESQGFHLSWKVIFRKNRNQASDAAASGDAAAAKATPQQPPPQPPRTATAENVVAILQGQGPLAEETIVVGAHYDHLGTSKDGDKTVFNGANDNASGTAAMIEVARILSARKERLPRRVVFVAFAAEERGLVGSFYYINHPPVPLDSTIAMLNLDMVGRPNDNTLATAGTANSPQLRELVNRIGSKHGFSMFESPGGFTGSDHLPFSGHSIPVVHFITTGGFGDYHRPSDDADKLDIAWMGRVASMTADLVVAVAETPERPKFVAAGWTDSALRGAVRLWGNLNSPKLAPPSTPEPAK